MDDTLARATVERNEKWQEACDIIPFIKFPADWSIQIIPPFVGAMVRFRVKLPNGQNKSIYLDFYDRLGYVGKPYWEVYPVGGDTGRCLLAETDELLRLIAAPRDESDAGSTPGVSHED